LEKLEKNIRITKININANTITSQEGNNNKNNNQQPEQRKPNGHKEQQSKKKKTEQQEMAHEPNQSKRKEMLKRYENPVGIFSKFPVIIT